MFSISSLAVLLVRLGGFFRLHWRAIAIVAALGGGFIWHQVHAKNALKAEYTRGYLAALDDIERETAKAQKQLDEAAKPIAREAANTIDKAQREARNASVEIQVAIIRGEDPVIRWNAGLDRLCDAAKVCAARWAEDQRGAAAGSTNASATPPEPASLEGLSVTNGPITTPSSVTNPITTVLATPGKTVGGANNAAIGPPKTSPSLFADVRNNPGLADKTGGAQLAILPDIDLPCEALSTYQQSCVWLKEDYGKLAVFSIDVMTALSSSEAKRAGLVALIEAANRAGHD